MENEFPADDIAIYRCYVSLRRIFKESTGHGDTPAGDFDAAFGRVLMDVASGDLTLIPGIADAMAASPPPEELRELLLKNSPPSAQRERDFDRVFAQRLLEILQYFAEQLRRASSPPNDGE